MVADEQAIKALGKFLFVSQKHFESLWALQSPHMAPATRGALASIADAWRKMKATCGLAEFHTEHEAERALRLALMSPPRVRARGGSSEPSPASTSHHDES